MDWTTHALQPYNIHLPACLPAFLPAWLPYSAQPPHLPEPMGMACWHQQPAVAEGWGAGP